ncbi:MAG TPA: class I SAM-dependent methyltransferase [Solirubrobacteraceae bacterium]
MSGSDAISPTAHYTGYVWSRNGLSHPALTTNEGRVLFSSLEPVMLASRTLGGPSLERYLLARHRAIDARLEHAIEHGAITQVVEVAAGLSPRGWRFSERYGDRITYIEADLPAMAARKRRALERMETLGDRHRVRDIDALADDGPLSLAALAAELDRSAGLALITEGLLGYVSPSDLEALWRRLATIANGFRAGVYISDLHLGSAQTPEVRVFRLLLSGFVRGGVYLHFDSAAQAEDQLREAGFASAAVSRADRLISDPNDLPRGRGGQMAHILEASTE